MAETHETKGCVCLGLLCGLPASGKSTLSGQIRDYARDILHGQPHVLVISYDQLIPVELEQQLIAETAEQGGSLWKSARSQIVSCIECLLNQCIGPSNSVTQFVRLSLNHNNDPHFEQQDKGSSHSANVQGLCKPLGVDTPLWERFLHVISISLTKAAVSDLDPNGASCSWLILIDDNMHYSSMRYEYCQLARKYEIGLCILHTSCLLEEALARNRLRAEGQVQDHVIYLMHERLETPDSGKHPWEKHSATVDTTLSPDLQPLLQLVNEAMMDPQRSSFEENTEEKEVSRHICSTSAIHQADQILRRCVSQRMAEAKATGLQSGELKTLSAELTKLRTTILSDMRKAEITLPFLLDETSISNASKDEHSPLYQFVQNLFVMNAQYS